MLKLAASLCAAVTAMLATAIVPDAAQAQNIRDLYAQNNCHHPLRFFIYHRHDDGWATHGWFAMPARSGRMLLEYADGRPMGHQQGDDLYFYAEVTTRGVDYQWEGGTRVEFSGLNYGVMRSQTLRVDAGQMYTWFDCGNLR